MARTTKFLPSFGGFLIEDQRRFLFVSQEGPSHRVCDDEPRKEEKKTLTL